MRNSVTIISYFFALLVVAGCAVLKPETVFVAKGANIEITSDGIVAITIAISPKGGELSDQLANFGTSIEDVELVSRLMLDGIHVRKILSTDVSAITTSIGEVVGESLVSHGQILHWRDVKQRMIPSDGMLVMQGGISYFIESGYLSLLARSWLVEREDGLFVYLQVLPTWHIPRGRSLIVGKITEPLQSVVFSNLMLETLLLDEEAILFAVELNFDVSTTGSQDDEPTAVRLGEALMGIPGNEALVLLLILQANLQ